MSRREEAQGVWEGLSSVGIDPMSFATGRDMVDEAKRRGIDPAHRRSDRYAGIANILDRQLRYRRGERSRP